MGFSSSSQFSKEGVRIVKIKAKFVRPAPLDTISDSADGSRSAIRPVAQTVKGLKTFKGMNVAGDPSKGDKSLVNYGDLLSAWDDGRPVSIAETVELTAEHIVGKKVTLRHPRLAGSVVKFMVEGSAWYVSEAHFSVSGSTISWSENAELCGKLSVGDRAYIRYTTLKG